MARTSEEARKLMVKAGMPPDEISRQLGEPIPKPTKPHTRAKSYGAKRTYSDMIGRNFASNFERKVGETLWLRQEAKEIHSLKFQPRVKLLGIVSMVPDFRYKEDGETIWHEAKGFADDRWRLQVKFWELFGPGEYRVTRQKGVDQIIRPKPNDEVIRLVLAWLSKEYAE